MRCSENAQGTVAIADLWITESAQGSGDLAITETAGIGDLEIAESAQGTPQGAAAIADLWITKSAQRTTR